MTQKNPIRLLLVDDHTIVREGIRSCLSCYSHLQFVGETGNGSEALRLAKKLKPDVVLMDIGLPGINGLEATKRLTQAIPRVRILVLTVHRDKEYAAKVIQAGGRGYILKDTSPAQLVKAIEAVHAGRSFFSPFISQSVIQDYARKEAVGNRSQIAELTDRERMVLALLADGYSNKEIADSLELGTRTIETHRARIMRKLNLHNVAGLTKFALAHGLINLEHPPRSEDHS